MNTKRYMTYATALMMGWSGEPRKYKDVREWLASQDAERVGAMRNILAAAPTMQFEDAPVPEGTHRLFGTVADLAKARVNVMMVGPAGCGKTYLASQVASYLGMRFSSISCSAGMSESQLAGWLLPSEGGAFSYSPSPFVDMYENGGVFLLDELDSADPNTVTFINKALANSEFYVPQRKENPCVKKHPDFVAMAAANTFGTGADVMYVGRNQLDAATLDRFAVGQVYMGYDAGLEQRLVSPEVYSACMQVRDAIAAHRLKRIMSTRSMINVQAMVETGWAVKKALGGYFSGWPREEIARAGLSFLASDASHV